MSEELDPDRLNALPSDLRAAFEAQQRALVAERAARRTAETRTADLADRNTELAARNDDLATRNDDLKTANDRLEHLIAELRRARFGPRSEKLDEAQLSLAFEDIETTIAQTEETLARGAGPRSEARSETGSEARRPRTRALPGDLPRVERVIEPESLDCPCGCGKMVRIGEDRSERLDVTPARYRVIVSVRPRYACAKGRTGVRQAAAPAHLIEKGVPTEALLAQVIVAKYSEHMPLYRQAQVFARHGVPLERATLADWVGRAAFHLDPIVERMSTHIKTSSRLFMDETTAPVLDPGRGRTKTGYLWAMLRDDRGWGGQDPPAVLFRYAPGRAGAHAQTMLAGFEGVVQVDGYAGYNRLTRNTRTGGAPLTLAYCWAHARREVIKATPKAGSAVAEAILAHISTLYAIEADIRGQDPDTRWAERQARARPVLDELHGFLKAQRDRLSAKSNMGMAIAYLVRHWDGLCRYIEDGRLEMDNNPVENLIRPLALNRKNALFAGHDEGGRNWARLASLIATCKLNDVEPFAWLKATLEALAAGHPARDIDALMPWAFDPATTGGPE